MDKKSFFIGFTLSLLLSVIFIALPIFEQLQETERLNEYPMLITDENKNKLRGVIIAPYNCKEND